jgi:hypothetical protein
MINNPRIRNLAVTGICLLHILLFTYAAANKLLDFENFQVQLGQSPLLSAFAGIVSYSVPAVELAIALALCSIRYRTLGLYCAFSLMVMFTAYIVIILNFSPFVPCSCGGVLEKMTWREHLFFNAAFVGLGFAGILLSGRPGKRKMGFEALAAGITALCSVAVMVLLFVLSEGMMHHRNNFVRRFPHHPAMLAAETDIRHDSFYFAGADSDAVYLGNSVAPLSLLKIDMALQRQQLFRISLPDNPYKFRSVKLRVDGAHFYLSDGTVPCIFKGSTLDWKAELVMYGDAYFNSLEPMGADRFAIRAISSRTRENLLGTVALGAKVQVKLSDRLLTKQIDGVFDTDGLLLYNPSMDKMLYTYYYRNEFLLAEPSLELFRASHTIDTTTHADIKVTYIKSRKESKMSAPPKVVNKNTATWGNYLFVHAGLMGKYEPREMWETASIIDVYDLNANTYAFSFYLHDKDGVKLSGLLVRGDLVFALNGRYLSVHRLKTDYYKYSPGGAAAPESPGL